MYISAISIQLINNNKTVFIQSNFNLSYQYTK